MKVSPAAPRFTLKARLPEISFGFSSTAPLIGEAVSGAVLGKTESALHFDPGPATSGQPGDQRHQEQHEEEPEQDLCNTRGGAGDAKEPEHCCQNGDHEENKCVA